MAAKVDETVAPAASRRTETRSYAVMPTRATLGHDGSRHQFGGSVLKLKTSLDLQLISCRALSLRDSEPAHQD
jgi:hypothetical protein